MVDAEVYSLQHVRYLFSTSTPDLSTRAGIAVDAEG